LGFFKKLFSSVSSDSPPTLGRNDPCWCGSGKKYKKCHMESDERKRTRTRAETCSVPSG
jgi:hypothetical protein